MLSRGVSLRPARLLLLRQNPARLSRSLRFRCMSLKSSRADDDDNNATAPPTKMSKLTDTLRVKKMSEHATLPVRGSDGAAGYDLAAAYDYVVPARGKELVKTDLSIAIPKDTYARIAPRSGLAWKHFIDTGAGVVDYDYRGNVGVILFNHGEKDFVVKKGDRVAQMILERIATPEVVEVEDLEATERGAGGFGSTGA